jgi:hypothetical protein
MPTKLQEDDSDVGDTIVDTCGQFVIKQTQQLKERLAQHPALNLQDEAFTCQGA